MSRSAVLKSTASESELHNGVDRDDRQELSQHLSTALADTYMLYVKTQAFHWNIVGPMFYSVHKLTEEQYEDMAEAIDTIAERIRALGFVAPGSFKQYGEMSSIKEETGVPNAEEMIKQLVEGNEICARKLRKASEAADEVKDIRTADLLTERVGQHEENVWMLSSLIK